MPAPDLRDCKQGPLLQHGGRQLRWVAGVRKRLPAWLDLWNRQHLQGGATLLHARNLRHTRRGTLLWHGGGRMRGQLELSGKLSNCGMGV